MSAPHEFYQRRNNDSKNRKITFAYTVPIIEPESGTADHKTQKGAFIMKIGIIGAGRIGKVHIRNISLFVPGMEIKRVADPFANEETAAYAKQFGIDSVTKEAADILNDPEIDAVVIASSTDTHAKYIIEAARHICTSLSLLMKNCSFIICQESE